ncbi:MAG: FAD:protein FMN transferase [Flavobacteriales bacterium]|jgi:thiamine biosynthesis lipoprotein|nr:FAD:protein FMN transferase [Flavobacteriales bacterium]
MRSAVLILSLLGTISIQSKAQHSVSQNVKLMGSAFAFTAIHADSVLAKKATDAAIAEVQRIESLISSWNSQSETSAINQNAGVKPVKVSLELLQLIERSLKVSKISNGYFDISFASIDKIWTFDGRSITAPDQFTLSQSVSKIGFDKIIIDKEKGTVFLKEEGMKIGFGAIGKGYAANRAKKVMTELGIMAGVVNAGGDLISWGNQPNGKPWSIGIADPKDKENIISWLDITDMAVVTSGNYEKFVLIDGKRYGHIINPKTGWPVTGLLSVTIVCSDAELADALATTVFVLGKDEGLKLINHLTGVECILIDEENQMHYSNNIKTRLL